jgi:predicted Abi (CAAX) family protease
MFAALDSLKVVWVAARPVSADVVHLVAVGDVSFMGSIHKPVEHLCHGVSLSI